jgi:hypothetical protein
MPDAAPLPQLYQSAPPLHHQPQMMLPQPQLPSAQPFAATTTSAPFSSAAIMKQLLTAQAYGTVEDELQRAHWDLQRERRQARLQQGFLEIDRFARSLEFGR